MIRYAALLRGVNLAGHKQVAMVDLRELLTELGLSEPTSLLNSGNLVFGCARQGASALERLLEQECEKRLGLVTSFFLRSADEWQKIIAANPFASEAKKDPGHLLVHVLNEAPSSKQVAALQAAIIGREVVRARGREAYIVYPDGVGRSRLTTALLDRHLGRGTARNWNTVLKLDAALQG